MSFAHFRAWLHLPDRNHGNGYAPRTADRYADAMERLDDVLLDWDVLPKGRRLSDITIPEEFSEVKQAILNHPRFPGYNLNRNEHGIPENLNGTGKGDPSAALAQYLDYLISLQG